MGALVEGPPQHDSDPSAFEELLLLPGEFKPGDLVRCGGETVRVVDELLPVARGHGFFEDLQIMYGAWVEAIQGGHEAFATWPPRRRLPVRRPRCQR